MTFEQLVWRVQTAPSTQVAQTSSVQWVEGQIEHVVLFIHDSQALIVMHTPIPIVGS